MGSNYSLQAFSCIEFPDLKGQSLSWSAHDLLRQVTISPGKSLNISRSLLLSWVWLLLAQHTAFFWRLYTHQCLEVLPEASVLSLPAVPLSPLGLC